MALKTKQQKARVCIITTQWRDLYYGTVTATDAEVSKEHAVRVEDCRHIAYWKGPRGGLTSLAAEGPGEGSNIGAPVPMLVTGVAHLLECSAEAQAKFAAIKP